MGSRNRSETARVKLGGRYTTVLRMVWRSPPIQGQVIQLAMPTGNPKIITMTAASGASYFFRSTNGGKTWSKTVYFDGGLYFRDLEYVSGLTGYVIHFSGGPVLAYSDGLMKTANAGKSWTDVKIP